MSGTIPIGGPLSQGALQQPKQLRVGFASQPIPSSSIQQKQQEQQQGQMTASMLRTDDSFEEKAASNRPPGITSVSVSGGHLSQSYQTASPFRSTWSMSSPQSSVAASQHSPEQSAEPVPVGDGPYAKDAMRVLAMDKQLEEQMTSLGDGHPYAGQMAVSFANMCVDVARGCISEGKKKLARLLLEKAIHILKKDHSATSFGDNQKALAACYCNLGALMQKRNMPDEALRYIKKAIKIESTMDYEPSHAATYINASATYSLLGMHDEGLAAAKRAVDMLCARPGWQNDASEPDSEAGELLPVAFNNLGIEFEHTGDKQMALDSYGYAVDLATKRWGSRDERTAEFKVALEEMKGGKELVKYDIEMARKFYGTKSAAGQQKAQRGKLKLLRSYVETQSPVERSEERAAGWFSPRFWSSTDGMKSRRVSAFNKDVAQIGLEMAKTINPAMFPSLNSNEPWGESRVKWRDVQVSDLARIDGSVPSRSRLFSDVAPNTKLGALATLTEKRQQLAARYPKNYGVYKKGLEMSSGNKARILETRSDTFLDGTYLVKPVRLR